ncbi:uncharacterized protein At5g39570-like [Andrographis paniculata]|uniref:uncharacterized protein At5g39570-like n=1 Tax=Andrographis paniculata TaxID=175694 RepID=UPI0021E9538B|nr:uncharacterized protein At5g39570-like [Andrographis paniculata]
MSYYPKGHHRTGEDSDDFNEYDPTPYGGGYDISVAYGRPLPPSDETCYPNRSGSLDFDYGRPLYASFAEPCAYADKALEQEYRSYARPGPRPAPSPPGGPPPPHAKYVSGEHRPNYGYQPGMDRPGGGHEFGRKPEPPYGSAYGRKPDHHISEYGSGYESGYGRRPQPEFGSEYERKPEYEHPHPPPGYGSRPNFEYEHPNPPPGYSSRPKFERQRSDIDTTRYMNPNEDVRHQYEDYGNREPSKDRHHRLHHRHYDE